MKNTFYRAAIFTATLAFVVIVLGVFVRLSGTGLEMIHRYLAGLLAAAIAVLAVMALRNRKDYFQPVILPCILLVLVVVQALPALWIENMSLTAGLVLLHLLGGVATFSLLAWLALRSNPRRLYTPPASARALKPWISAAIGLLVIQVALGGWTSANDAALSCPDFPTCMGQWWPESDFAGGFVYGMGSAAGNEGGGLREAARIAIHMAHRVGALVMLFFLAALSIKMMRTPALDLHGKAVLFILLLQISLGVINVLLQVPLINAVAHSSTASILLFTLVTALHRAVPRRGM